MAHFFHNSEEVKTLVMKRMKAAELVEAAEPVLHRDCPLCSTGCCISARQWVSSLLVFPGLLWLFKYLELLACSSSPLLRQFEWL